MVLFALGPINLFFGYRAVDVDLDGAIWRKQLFNGAGRKINASLGHDRVNDLGRALKLRPARSIIT